MIFLFLLCVCLCYTLEGLFQKKKFKKESGVIIVGSGLETVGFIFYRKEMIKNVLINHWLDIRKLLQIFSGTRKVKHFFHLLFLKTVSTPLCMYYRTFSELF